MSTSGKIEEIILSAPPPSLTTPLPPPGEQRERLQEEKEAAFSQLFRVIDDLHRLRGERDAAFRQLEEAHRETLLRLALAAEYKDGETGDHLERIGVLSAVLAQVLGQPELFCRLLRHAAPMHDIGKIGIPDSVLKKPGPLTAEERTVMQQHARIGAQILGGSEIPLLNLGAELALTHHERYDGTGYPRGLAGEAIPLSGRIVALVDFFDALTMDRCYRPALAVETAIAMMREGRGSHFDPQLVDAFMDARSWLLQAREEVNRRHNEGLGLKQEMV